VKPGIFGLGEYSNQGSSSSMKKTLAIIILTFILAAVLFFFLHQLRWDEALHWKIYGKLQEAQMRLAKPPEAIKDILLITIGNQTLGRQKKRWPFPRSHFAQVINNLSRAGAKVIAFDFVFPGESTSEEDAQLKSSFANKRVILATAINENGRIEVFSFPDLTANPAMGFITKLQDQDGVIRRNLTYLVNESQPASGILSWEMRILKEAKDIDLQTLRTKGDVVYFQNNRGERWEVPVERRTNGFLIKFCANTVNFNRISFYRILENDFAAAQIKDKIVLVGATSSLLQDIHLTPIGWLPGITLNANAFLTLYTRNFLKEVPGRLQLSGLIMALIISAGAVALLRRAGGTLFVILELFFFIVLSYQLLANNYYWNYSLFPILVSLCPFWARRIYQSLPQKMID